MLCLGGSVDPSSYLSTLAPCRFESDTGIRMRFVVGKLQDVAAQNALQQEQLAHQDFEVVNVPETYANLVLKARIH